MVSELLQQAKVKNASDLHLSAGLPPMLRIDGEIIHFEQPAYSPKQVREAVYTVMNNAQIRALEAGKEVDFAFSINYIGRFRINVFHQSRGLSAAFRYIPDDVPTLANLDCPELFAELTHASNGLILLTGPTGSGKSTTLAAMVNHLNVNTRKHILTIEDPIEFIHTPNQCLINQREVNRDTSSFDNALRAALREDPDVILVGEMRDLDTIRLALTAAETGHLVLATLHTYSASKAIDRIIDVFPSGEKNLIRAQLAESLNAVIAQTLVKKISGGRLAAWEIMTATPAIKNLIREDKTAQMLSVMQTGRSHGMLTQAQSLKALAEKGVISLDSMEMIGGQSLFPER